MWAGEILANGLCATWVFVTKIAKSQFGCHQSHLAPAKWHLVGDVRVSTWRAEPAAIEITFSRNNAGALQKY